MDLISVSSSNVSSIGYVYRYPNCNEQLFNAFLNAPSKGAFVHQHLKGHGETRIR